MRTIDDHRRDITALLAGISGSLGTEALEVSGAAITADPAAYGPFGADTGRVLAADLMAPSSLPAFDNSQMDGYAVVAAELAPASAAHPVRLAVAARVAAGDPFSAHRAGTATPVMTGAPIPAGADAVVQIERADPPRFPAGGSAAGLPDDAEREGDDDTERAADGDASHETGGVSVAFVAPVEAGTFVRAAGSDVAEGEVLLPAGTTLGPAQYGVIAGTGATSVTVRRRIRVLLISTGHEIRDPGTTLQPGQIFDANTVALSSALIGAGCTVIARPCRSDDADDLLALIRAETGTGTGVDLIVTVGGVSAGAREVVRDALGPRGVEFMKVAMQPGGPQGFGTIQLEGEPHPVPSGQSAGGQGAVGRSAAGPGAVGVPVVCLPGNPVSALVSFEAFLRPALRAAAGVQHPLRETRTGRAAHAFDSPPTHHQLRRGVVHPDGSIELIGGPSSHLLHSYAASNALVHVPLGVSAVAAGDELDYWRIDG